MVAVSKTDYILWRDCQKNAWIRAHKPEIFEAEEITEFDQSLIDTGVEVEAVARGLFPGGELVKGRNEEARKATDDHLARKTPILFQPFFKRDGFVAAIDVLEFKNQTNSFAIYEIKSSTKLKDEHLYDAAFQVLLLRRCGLKIDQVFIVHLNSKYVRQGQLDLASLFVRADVSQKVDEVAQAVEREMDAARAYLLSEKEPEGPCSCIYRGRSRHCTTFQYSNPSVPEYGVHDIARIGNSPKKLKEMIDAGVYSLDKIPTHIALSDIQQAQIRAYNSGKTEIRKTEINTELQKLKFPLYFIDYETYSPAIPLFDGFAPYDDIPFQYSLHVVRSLHEEPTHEEFLCERLEDPTPLVLRSLRAHIGPDGSIIVWNKSFESGINENIAHRIPEAQEFIAALNGRIYDLKEVFSKQHYVHKDLWGKVSIKKVLPVLAPGLNYSTLTIQEGATASITWNKIVSDELSDEERKQLCDALKKYCATDSYAMYAIWQALQKLAAN